MGAVQKFFTVGLAATWLLAVGCASEVTGRGGGSPSDLDDAMGASGDGGIDLLALNEALEGLARLNERHRKVVELRFFGGLSIEETAHVLGVSPRSIGSDWQMARAWLQQRLRD